MWSELITLTIRRLLIIILGNAAISAFLGPDLVNYLLKDKVVSGIVGVVGVAGLYVWSIRGKIIARVRLKLAAASEPTTVREVKAEVAKMPFSDKRATAFNTEPAVSVSGVPVEKIVTASEGQ